MVKFSKIISLITLVILEIVCATPEQFQNRTGQWKLQLILWNSGMEMNGIEVPMEIAVVMSLLFVY